MRSRRSSASASFGQIIKALPGAEGDDMAMKTEKVLIIPVTTGDIMHLMGGFGLRMD